MATAWPVSLMSLHDPVLPISAFIQEAEQEFERMKTTSADTTVNITFLVEQGPLTETVINVAERENVDLIVMSTTGAQGLKAFFIGSHSEKIVRRLAGSRVCNPSNAACKGCSGHYFSHVPGFNAKRAANKSEETARHFSGRSYMYFTSNNFPTSLIRDEEAEASLQDYARFFSLTRYTLNVRKGVNLDEGIMNFASNVPGSIIAMSSHGYKGFEHLLKGSVAEDVVNQSSEPVWTYVAPEK
ncbi:universal stress protein [Paucibacter sp. O1-1]|nr:universal stress protein [Paucibacter sp. O1-1]MDA3830746.1 universal stress protein [Paucibacter sp. O1-1]